MIQQGSPFVCGWQGQPAMCPSTAGARQTGMVANRGKVFRKDRFFGEEIFRGSWFFRFWGLFW
jgi:hypothetical protein